MCIYINGICRKINLSSRGVQFKHCCFIGNPISFALEQTGSFSLLRFDWQVEQIHFVLSIIALVVIHASGKVVEHLGYLFASHFLADDQFTMIDYSKYMHVQDHTYCYREKFE